jgi:two-component system CheB/CheR fusion protein
LEPSNEELQSVNEDMQSTNEELRVTASELSGRTCELTSILQSTPFAILVTGSALQISQATMAASDLFCINRPIATPHISQLTLPEGYPALAPICSETLRLRTTTEHGFSSQGAHAILMCTPYFDVNGKILGLTIVVTQFPGLALEMEALFETSHIFLINRTAEGKILRVSNSSTKTLGLTRDDAAERNLFDILPADQAANSRKIDDMILNGDGTPLKEIVKLTLSDPENPNWLAMEWHKFNDPRSEDLTVLSIASDVIDLIKATDQTNFLLDLFRHLQELASIGNWIWLSFRFSGPQRCLKFMACQKVTALQISKRPSISTILMTSKWSRPRSKRAAFHVENSSLRIC